jgi:hypothetical protein
VGKRVEGPVPSPPHELLHLLPHLRLRIEGGRGAHGRARRLLRRRR